MRSSLKGLFERGVITEEERLLHVGTNTNISTGEFDAYWNGWNRDDRRTYLTFMSPILDGRIVAINSSGLSIPTAEYSLLRGRWSELQRSISDEQL